MKSALQTKLLQHFSKKKNQNGGFTLIELLVVIVIVGVLAAIALPSFLNQASKAKESEAKSHVGAINRGQQAFRVENPTFAATLPELKLGINFDDSEYYEYVPSVTAGTQADATATPTDTALKGVRGCVTADGEGITSARLTVAPEAGDTPDSCAAAEEPPAEEPPA